MGRLSPVASLTTVTMKALLLAARTPWPARRGDQMRARDTARGLARLGYDVEVLTAGAVEAGTGGDQGEGTRVESRPPDLLDRVLGASAWAVGGEPLQTTPFRSRALVGLALARVRALGEEDVVVVQLARQLPLVRALRAELANRRRRPRLVVDLIDLLSLNFRLRADLDLPWLGPLWRSESRRLERAEGFLLGVADAVALVCARDRDELARRHPVLDHRAAVTPLLVEPGDLAGAAATTGGEGPNGKAAGTLALTGNLGYEVNRRAVRWFLSRVWPRLRTERPGIRLVVAGARPDAAMRRMVRGAEARLVANPADLRSVLRSADLAVAPLEGGAGVPVKVLEAWAEGVAVVASDWTARGTRLVGETMAHVDRVLLRLPAEAPPGDWCRAIDDLLDDEPRRASLVAAGRHRIRTRHGEEALVEAFGELLEIAGETRAAARR